jgi:hypothetical protein
VLPFTAPFDPAGLPPIPAGTDQEWADTVAQFRAIPELELKLGRCVRDAFDDVLDTFRTGRIDIYHKTEVSKVERTYVGSRVEIRVIADLEFTRGIVLDLDLNGIEVDVKFTIAKNWAIPKEAVGRLCLLIKADDRTSRFSAGVLRCGYPDPKHLNDGVNRDGKRTVSGLGRSEIIPVVLPNSPFPSNFLLALPESVRQAVFAHPGQQNRYIELFTQLPRVVIKREVLAAIGGSQDPIRRIRAVKPALAARGLEVLVGQYPDERARAARHGVQLGKGEWVAI